MGRDFGADLGAVSLQRCGAGFHRDGFGDGAHLQVDVHAHDGIDGDDNVGLRMGGETLTADSQIIGSGLKSGKAVAADFIGDRLAGLVGLAVRDADGGAGDDRL
jgi:hypothetical protein